jgi:hypothetical protein
VPTTTTRAAPAPGPRDGAGHPRAEVAVPLRLHRPPRAEPPVQRRRAVVGGADDDDADGRVRQRLHQRRERAHHAAAEGAVRGERGVVAEGGGEARLHAAALGGAGEHEHDVVRRPGLGRHVIPSGARDRSAWRADRPARDASRSVGGSAASG